MEKEQRDVAKERLVALMQTRNCHVDLNHALGYLCSSAVSGTLKQTAGTYHDLLEQFVSHPYDLQIS